MPFCAEKMIAAAAAAYAAPDYARYVTPTRATMPRAAIEPPGVTPISRFDRAIDEEKLCFHLLRARYGATRRECRHPPDYFCFDTLFSFFFCRCVCRCATPRRCRRLMLIAAPFCRRAYGAAAGNGGAI